MNDCQGKHNNGILDTLYTDLTEFCLLYVLVICTTIKQRCLTSHGGITAAVYTSAVLVQVLYLHMLTLVALCDERPSVFLSDVELL